MLGQCCLPGYHIFSSMHLRDAPPPPRIRDQYEPTKVIGTRTRPDISSSSTIFCYMYRYLYLQITSATVAFPCSSKWRSRDLPQSTSVLSRWRLQDITSLPSPAEHAKSVVGPLRVRVWSAASFGCRWLNSIGPVASRYLLSRGPSRLRRITAYQHRRRSRLDRYRHDE
jgi:hypothetical protein